MRPPKLQPSKQSKTSRCISTISFCILLVLSVYLITPTKNIHRYTSKLRNIIRKTQPYKTQPYDGSPMDICIKGPAIGRTFNQIMTIGNVLRPRFSNSHIKIYSQQQIYLSKQITPTYLQFFQQSHRIVPYDGERPCKRTIRPAVAMYGFGRNPVNGINSELNLENMPLKNELYQKALQIIDKVTKGTGKYISVHQRWLEGGCKQRAKQYLCPHYTDEEAKKLLPNEKLKLTPHGTFAYACNYTKSMVTSLLPLELRMELKDVPIILFTDGQLKTMEFDFQPYVNHDPFNVQFVMQLLSSFHFGNPMSSIDYVIASFRGGETISPESCYNYQSKKKPYVIGCLKDGTC